MLNALGLLSKSKHPKTQTFPELLPGKFGFGRFCAVASHIVTSGQKYRECVRARSEKKGELFTAKVAPFLGGGGHIAYHTYLFIRFVICITEHIGTSAYTCVHSRSRLDGFVNPLEDELKELEYSMMRSEVQGGEELVDIKTEVCNRGILPLESVGHVTCAVYDVRNAILT